MFAYKVIGLLMVLAALSYSLLSWLREYLNERQRRKNRRWARKCRNTYKESFRKGTLRDIEQWRGEYKPDKRLNVICKNPAYADAWK